MHSIRFDDKAVLITGAASGIGRETAILFASRGARLFLCDVNDDGLEETARLSAGYGNPVRSDRVDVSSREDVRSYAELIHRDVAAIDVLVNNAGVAVGGGFLDTTLEDWDFLVGTNLWGVIYGCHYFIPPMVARKRGGHVVNVASAAGLVGFAELAAYATTKFGVVGLSESLREELASHRIGVSAVCPGIVNTGMVRAARMRGPDGEADRARIVEAYRRRNYGPQKVAQAIASAVSENKGLVPVTPEAWAVYAVKRAAPNLLPRLMRQVKDRTRR